MSFYFVFTFRGLNSFGHSYESLFMTKIEGHCTLFTENEQLTCLPDEYLPKHTQVRCIMLCLDNPQCFGISVNVYTNACTQHMNLSSATFVQVTVKGEIWIRNHFLTSGKYKIRCSVL